MAALLGIWIGLAGVLPVLAGLTAKRPELQPLTSNSGR